MQPINHSNYIAAIKERGRKAHMTKEYQLVGFEIAVALHDLEHKSLYIKYAKELGCEPMLALAKDIASRRDVKNLGAYFMKVVKEQRSAKR